MSFFLSLSSKKGKREGLLENSKPQFQISFNKHNSMVDWYPPPTSHFNCLLECNTHKTNVRKIYLYKCYTDTLLFILSLFFKYYRERDKTKYSGTSHKCQPKASTKYISSVVLCITNISCNKQSYYNSLVFLYVHKRNYTFCAEETENFLVAFFSRQDVGHT